MSSKELLTIIGYGVLAIVGLVFLYLVRSILPPFIISVVLALLLDPVVNWLQTKRIARGFAILIVFLAFVLVCAAGVTYLAPKVINQVSQLSQDYNGYYEQGSRWAGGVIEKHKPLLTRLHLYKTQSEALAIISDKIRAYSGEALNVLGHTLTGFLAKSVWLILIILITTMLLKDFDKIRAKFMYLIPETHRDRALGTARAVGAVFGNYIRGLVTVCLLYGVVATVAFSILGLRYALVIGIVSGLLYAVPYVGPFTTGLIVFLVSFVQHPDKVYLALLYSGGTFALNQVFDMLLTPRIVGGAVGLHPILSIFALTAGGAVFGVVGMVLAVPIAASIQVLLCEFFPKLRKPLAEFGGKAKPATNPAKSAKSGGQKKR